jgi:hypothetical protein
MPSNYAYPSDKTTAQLDLFSFEQMLKGIYLVLSPAES